MKPYYQAHGITIYCGDCRKLAPRVSDGVDLILTDPPYGIKYKPGASRGGFVGSLLVRGDDKPFDPAFILDMGLPTILCGANHYAERLPSSPSWVVWDKREKLRGNSHADCELIWTNTGGPARMFRHYWYGFHRASERGQKRVHPTQKPIVLMEWLIQRTKGATRILDPFIGSGTTLIAARNLGRDAVGIEIEERYCEIAAQRLEGIVPQKPDHIRFEKDIWTKGRRAAKAAALAQAA